MFELKMREIFWDFRICITYPLTNNVKSLPVRLYETKMMVGVIVLQLVQM